jgi:carboxymethylenebutenolidase
MPQEPALTDSEQKLDDVWNEHLRAEFSTHNPDETIVTMSANPLINQVPVMIGGDGREQVYEFYTNTSYPRSQWMLKWSRCPGRLAKGGW